MKRLTERHYKESDGYYMKCSETCHIDCGEKSYCEEVDNIVDRLGSIEDILGDEYDLDRLSVVMSQCMSLREEVAQRINIVGKIPIDHLRELVNADRDGRFVIVTRCCECNNHVEFDGKHYCKFWRMYCPDDSDFYCKAASKGDKND